MSEHFMAPAEHFYPLPDRFPLEMTALIEPMAVAWHAVQISPFRPGDNVLIIGAGPVGLNILQVLRLQGAKNIIVAEIMKNRKEFAWHFGATEVVDSRETDLVTSVRSLTGGVGADVVFDAAGVEGMLNAAIPACRVHGTVVNVAVWEKRPQIDANQMMYHEVRYMGAALFDEEAFRQTIAALDDGRLRATCPRQGNFPFCLKSHS
jgi:threonine dehydrogenase-like Zn-dependent dehydrogenase